jgi:hypothetical protein
MARPANIIITPERMVAMRAFIRKEEKEKENA